MRVTCNINAFGRMVRIATGLILLTDGILMVALDFPSTALGWRFVQAVLILMGAFAVFEGAIGWCALRAMGYRTRF
ncbi:MAG: hypothetical protein ACR2IE_18395 [Candidatus Sumerlaeaceae bacterium]